MKYKKIMIALAATGSTERSRMRKLIKRHRGSNTDTGSDSRTDFNTGNSQSAADFNTGTEAYWCEDKYREICLSLKQHQG